MDLKARPPKVQSLIKEYRSMVDTAMQQLTTGDYRGYLERIKQVDELARRIERSAPRKFL